MLKRALSWSAVAALVLAAGVARWTTSSAAEPAQMVPPPYNRRKGFGVKRDDGARRRLFLGRAGCVPAC